MTGLGAIFFNLLQLLVCHFFINIWASVMKRNLSAYSHIVFFCHTRIHRKYKAFLTKLWEKFLTTSFLCSSRRRHTSSFSSSDRRIVSPPNQYILGRIIDSFCSSNLCWRNNIRQDKYYKSTLSDNYDIGPNMLKFTIWQCHVVYTSVCVIFVI